MDFFEISRRWFLPGTYEYRTLKSKLKLRKKNIHVADTISQTVDRELFALKKKNIEELTKNISDLKKTRQREFNRKSKLEALVSELNSLKMNLDVGAIKCGDCGSTNIVYANKDFEFEVSNVQVKDKIISSIKNNIKEKSELIEELTVEVNNEQEKLNAELTSTSLEFKNLLIFQDDILSEQKVDSEAFEIESKMRILEDELKFKSTLSASNTDEKTKFIATIVDTMNSLYRTVDPNGNLVFEDVFAKRDATFSGSESQEYYFCRLLSINAVLQHKFPIIIDSFRDGEISTNKEAIMLEAYKKAKKQILLTSTLKEEEVDTSKYAGDKNINAIDYSSNRDSKILDSKFSNEFKDILKRFEGLMV